MGLFDKILVKKGADGLPESFAALYKATDYTQKGYDVHYGFRCLEKMYEIGKKAVIEDNMSAGDLGAIKGDHYFPRIQDLAEVYKTGEYWYDNDDEGRRYYFKVCEPDMTKHYGCYVSMAYAAQKLTKDFTKEYALKDDAMNEVPNYFLQAGIGYSQGHLKSPVASKKTKEFAVSFLDMAFELGCKRYGYNPGLIFSKDTSYIAESALHELTKLSDYLPCLLNDYVKKAEKNNIYLSEDLLKKIKEIDEDV